MTMAGASRRGGPLLTFVVIGVAWLGARAMLWESPFPYSDETSPDMSDTSDTSDTSVPLTLDAAKGWLTEPSQDQNGHDNKFFVRAEPIAGRNPSYGGFVRVPIRKDVVRVSLRPSDQTFLPASRWANLPREYTAQSSMGHTMLLRAAMRETGQGRLRDAAYRNAMLASAQGSGSSPTGPAVTEAGAGADRWTLDVWGFSRQGSSAAPISQGRVPTYGASQAGAKLAYRLAPKSGHDPRVFLRAYRALIANGESEIAAGGSARLLSNVPVRIAGEVRYTDTVLGGRFRPAGYAFTEIPPISLPGRFSLEAYAQGGYVGGSGSTFFADGQAVATRNITNFTAGKFGNARFSAGGGVWGGAQRGASRLDIGPTMRIDMKIGNVPTRVSVDWRQKIAGDAAPESGVAATISTRF